MQVSWFLLDSTTGLLLAATFLLSLLWLRATRRPPGLPPGPGPALPLLGHLYLLKNDPRPQFRQWRRQYGDVFSFYMGSRLVVVLSGYSTLKQALVKMADVFSERPFSFLTERVNNNEGVIFSSGSVWKEQRKTSLEILRQLGLGKDVLATRIQQEVQHYIQAIQDLKGAPTDLRQLTQTSVSNNIVAILFGRRFDYDDPQFSRYMNAWEEMVNALTASSLVNFYPVLEHLPGDMFKAKRVLKNVSTIHQFLWEEARAHMDTYSEEDCGDFIHAYIRQMKRRQEQGTPTTVTEQNLVKSCSDLFGAGTETTSTAVTWALLFFLHWPHVQDKCFKEISDVIGTQRPPRVQDRAKMPYLEATISEVLRKGNITPFAVQHGLTNDVRFQGYVIPRDAIVFPHLGSVLEDAEVWGDPENFRPERFIGPDGKAKREDELIPFSLGRRVCLGEALARVELFLYLATLVQRFRFLPAQEGELPSLEGILGGTHIPQRYRIRAVLRE